ncbi:MAG: ABC transporter ATP-binding protein [Xanthobacteraceae bacterium]|nr:ABC transporter ATP-binding protein [Xanthobacteraceae bacterium]
MPALAVKGLQAGYGKARVLHGVEFNVSRGELVVVIGRNGVGKTTLIETLCGLTTLQGGEIALYGKRVETLPSHRRSRLGLGWVPQEREVFGSLSVEENLTVVARPGPWTLEALYDLFPRLAARRRNAGTQLSGGEQQMLAIARALATNPSLLLLDEPVEGLAPLVVQELVAAIARMRDAGNLAILMVEQKFEIALAHSDRCLVMDRGEIVHRCPSQELLHDHTLLDRLIGVAE